MEVTPPIHRRLDQLRDLFDEAERPSQATLVSALIQCAQESVEALERHIDDYNRAYPKDTLLGETRQTGLVNLPKPPRAKG
jgi:hypothetical protein